MKRLLQIILLVVAIAPQYYGQARPNLYGGWNFYNRNHTFVGLSKPDLRGGYRYQDNNKTYKGYDRGNTGGRIYMPGIK